MDVSDVLRPDVTMWYMTLITRHCGGVVTMVTSAAGRSQSVDDVSYKVYCVFPSGRSEVECVTCTING